MGQKDVYNTISIVFLLLALVVCLCTAGILTDSIAVPGNLAPVTSVPIPSLRSKDTTLSPTITPPPTETGTPAPPPTWTPVPAPT